MWGCKHTPFLHIIIITTTTTTTAGAAAAAAAVVIIAAVLSLLSHTCRHSSTYAVVTLRRSGASGILRNSELTKHVVDCVCKYIQGSPVEIQTTIHWNLIGIRMTASICVIAQQYSSATVVLLRFHFRYRPEQAPWDPEV